MLARRNRERRRIVPDPERYAIVRWKPRLQFLEKGVLTELRQFHVAVLDAEC